MNPASSSRNRLFTPVRFLRGVRELEQPLGRLGLKTASDVLFFFPRRYEPMAETCFITDLEEGKTASVVAEVEEIDGRTTGSGKYMLNVLFRDPTDWLRGIWFNQPYVRDRLRVGQRVLVVGQPKMNGMRWEMTHPQLSPPPDESPARPGATLRPVYRLTEPIKQARMRRIVKSAVDHFGKLVPEVLPETLREQYQLLPILPAIQQMHAPLDATTLAEARRRFAFQELLVQQLAFAIRRQQVTTSRAAIPIEVSPQVDARIQRRFPFALTDGQRKVLDEIRQDLRQPVPMSRLLHGDVGSGKTVVAVYTMLAAVAAGCQVVLLAPTEILARQHVETLTGMLHEARVRIACWTGAVAASERRALRDEIAEGAIDIVVGTQAIVESNVQFKKLAVVIVDEQHRFGVRQRAGLSQGEQEPHYLVMTATPIPRTMALLAYGDLDVSILADAPHGRQPVHTYRVHDDQRERWWEFYRKQLRQGRQGYVIVARIETTDESDVANLQATLESLCNGELADFRIDILHGRMSADEKIEIMQSFRNGRGNVLLASSVVEIGIDVPNATVMTILNADRFGLAQLHQLRGRVGRGGYPGYVGLFADPKTDAAEARLDAILSTTDGFTLAEMDLEQRGPGEFFGTRQHGMPAFRVAQLPADAELLSLARSAARNLLDFDAPLALPQHALLRQQVLGRYGATLELGQIG